MQPCVVCGWDTGSGARLCSICRARQAQPPTDDALAEAEALLIDAMRTTRSGGSPERGATRSHRGDEQRRSDSGVPTGEFPVVLNDDAGAAGGRDDTADHLAALFNAPTPWDEPNDHGASEDLATLLNHPNAGHGARVADDESDPPISGIPAPGTPTPEPPEMRVPVEQSEHRERSTSAQYAPEEWPWLSKSGADDFWAPPADNVASTHTDQRDATLHADADGMLADEPVAGARDTDATGAVAGGAVAGQADRVPQEPAATPRQRMRTVFAELGGWTAIAQVALLAVGMLSVIQIFVLVVVLSYLNDDTTRSGDSAASLAAYAQIDDVMLPALFVFAVGALLLAAWRSFAGHLGGEPGRPALGMPLGLWGVLAGVIALLGVIVMSQATVGVVEAVRATQVALGACALLGLACFVAPRGLG